MYQDMRFAVRLLRQSPGFTLAAVVTLALGVGANTAIYSIVDAAVLRPLPYDSPDRLVTLTLHNPTSGRRTTGAMPRDFLDWRDQNDVFDQVSLTGGGLVTLLGAGEPEELRIARVTAGHFEMLRARPERGRTFTTDDELPDRNLVAMISQQFWEARFAKAHDIVGKTLRLDARSYEIVGVLPASFEYPVGAAQQTPVFLPFIFSAQDRQRGVVQSMGYNPRARLRDGVSISQAEAAMSRLQAALDADHLAFNKGYTRVELKPLLEDYVADARTWMLMLLGAVGLVLLISSANVANLVLAHATKRVRELSVRASLGAGPWRIARQLLAESLVLSTAGAVAGLAVAWCGLRILRTALPASIPRAADISLDARVLLLTMTVAVATGLVCGLLPAIQAARVDLVRGLRDGARGDTTGRTGRRVRFALAWTEIALAVMLLVGSGLFARSFIRLLRVDEGFDATGVMSLSVSGPRGADAAANRTFVLNALAAIRALPGTEAAVTESGGPYSGGYSSFPIRLPGRPAPASGEPEMIRFRKVSFGFLEMLHVPIRRGRGFAASDTAQAPPVALINETAARTFWPEGHAIGQPLTIEKTTFEIVGIVGDMRYGGPAAAVVPEAFLPFEQAAGHGGTFIVRAPPTSVQAVKAEIWRIDPSQPISGPISAGEMFDRATATRRFNTLLMLVFGVLALVIAVTGLYGVLAFIVGQRMREVGVRVALGARPSQVVVLFLKQGVVVLTAGVVSGLVGAWWLARMVQSFLFQIDARDATVFGGVALLLFIVGLVACWVPAKRAARIDPLTAMRAE